jgi:hypothetical protein
MDFPLRKEDLPILYLNFRGVKENRILGGHELLAPWLLMKEEFLGAFKRNL